MTDTITCPICATDFDLRNTSHEDVRGYIICGDCIAKYDDDELAVEVQELDDEALRLAGFRKWNTGGGCMAWILEHPHFHVLVTDPHGGDLPDGDGFLIGCYTDEGEALYYEDEDLFTAVTDTVGKAITIAKEMIVGAYEKSKIDPLDTDDLAAFAAGFTDLDDACFHIQRILGQDDGGVASVYFSGVEEVYRWADVRAASRALILRRYIDAEKAYLTVADFNAA